MKEKLNNRYLILSLGFIVFGLIIVFRLFNLQVVEGEKYNADSRNSVLKESVIEASRGKILDRNGVPIAINRQGFAIQIVKTDIDTSELNAMLLKLTGILDKNKVSYADSLSKYLTFNPITFSEKELDDIKKWQKNENRLNMKEEDVKSKPEELFQYLRNEKFKIDSSYSDEEAYKIMLLRYEILLDNWNFTIGGSISLAKDVGMDTISEIEERHHEFPGIITSIVPVREYVGAYDEAHVLGYIGAITQSQYDNLKDEGYGNNDLIGKAGVEKTAEKYLRGRDGKRSIEVDTSGRLTRQRETIAAVPGSDVVLTIDTNLQKVAMESLARNIELIRNKKGDKANLGDANAGSLVALNVNTGEVLAMASYPSYDPQIFLAGSEDKAAQQAIIDLNSDINKPQINRTIQEIYEPGSTFKPLTAIAALEKGVITPQNSRYYDSGHTNIGGRDFYCLEYPVSGHGWMDLKKALETSCNIYFYELGFKTTIDTLDAWAEHFGLGKETGIDLPGEKAGLMSSIQLKKELRDDIWRPADTAQVSIGQFDSNFTPLQLASYISTIANGGKRYKPYVMKKVVKYDGSLVNETQPSYTKVPVKQSTIDAVKEGMIAVAQGTDGTAYKSFIGLPFQVAGKTGTAQRSKLNSPTALFVCYAPADNPQIAIAVVIERGAWGSDAAPVARDIIDEYFGLKKGNTDDEVLKPEEPLFNP
ncbi:MAG: penicillin-binding protein 2 [Clostridiaceae bacterium]